MLRNMIIFCSFIVLSINSEAINPSANYIKTPKSYGLKYDSLNVKTSDGIRLTSWLIWSQKKDTANTVIISGSDAGNMSYYLDIANYINKNFDCNVVLYDYRGFGSSSLFNIDKSILTYPEYLDDLNNVINTIKTIPKIDTTYFILYGTSMGASLSICAAASRNDISAIFADSPFISQEDFCNNFNKGNPKEKITYINDEKLSPVNVIKEIPKHTKFTIISGQNDNNVTPNDIQKLYDKCTSEKKSIWIAPNCRHLEALPLYSEVYFGLFKLLFNK